MTTTIFSLQTTGIPRANLAAGDSAQPRMISMAAVMLSTPALEQRGTYEVLMRPEGSVSVADAMKAHGIKERELELYGIRRKVALATFMEMVRASREVMAFNLPFFSTMIDIELAQHRAEVTDWKRGGLKRTCMMELSAQHVNGGRAWKLADAHAAITGAPYAQPHDHTKAGADAQAIARMLRRIRNVN